MARRYLLGWKERQYLLLTGGKLTSLLKRRGEKWVFAEPIRNGSNKNFPFQSDCDAWVVEMRLLGRLWSASNNWMTFDLICMDGVFGLKCGWVIQELSLNYWSSLQVDVETLIPQERRLTMIAKSPYMHSYGKSFFRILWTLKFM